MAVIGSQAQTNLEANVFLWNPEASSIMDIPKHISEMMAKRTMSVTKQTTAIPMHIPTRTIIKSTGAKVFQIRENQLIILTARRHLKMYMEEKVKA